MNMETMIENSPVTEKFAVTETLCNPDKKTCKTLMKSCEYVVSPPPKMLILHVPVYDGLFAGDGDWDVDVHKEELSFANKKYKPLVFCQFTQEDKSPHYTVFALFNNEKEFLYIDNDSVQHMKGA